MRRGRDPWLVLQKQLSFSLGVKLFPSAFAFDFAVNDVAFFPVVQPMFDLHLRPQFGGYR